MQSNSEGFDRVSPMLDWTRERIRELRNSRGYTQKQLAEHLGVGVSRVGDIEQGVHDIKASTIFRVMEALSVTPIEFFTGAPPIRELKRKRR